MLTELPKVKIGRKTYYFDERLKRAISVQNSSDIIELSKTLVFRINKLLEIQSETKLYPKVLCIPIHWLRVT